MGSSMFAAKKVDNLIVTVTDWNNVQIDGSTPTWVGMRFGRFVCKFKGFRWEVFGNERQCDGRRSVYADTGTTESETRQNNRYFNAPKWAFGGFYDKAPTMARQRTLMNNGKSFAQLEETLEIINTENPSIGEFEN